MLSLNTNVPAVTPTEAWHEITAADGVTFGILVRSPTLSDALGDFGAVAAGKDDPFGAQAVHRIRSSVIDWRDVTDDPTEEGATPKPIPYSWEVFASVLQKFPQAMRQVMRIVYAAWSPDTEDSEKN